MGDEPVSAPPSVHSLQEAPRAPGRAGRAMHAKDGIGAFEVEESQVPSTLEPHLEVIRSDKTFPQLFTGYAKARIVTYVAGPSDILGLFERERFGSVELILSEDFNDLRNQLEVEVIGKLKELIESGRLSLFVPKPKNKIHSKLYILEGTGKVRLIFTSRNLLASRSVDIALYFDLPPEHPFVQETRRAYDQHLESTVPFFGDLFDKIREHPEEERQLIEAFLSGPDASTDTVPAILSEATHEAIQNPDKEVLTIRMPEGKGQRKRLEEQLEQVPHTVVDGTYRVNPQQFRSVISRAVQLPIMDVDRERGRVSEMIDGDVVARSAPPPERREEVAAALAHVEDYLATIDVEHASDNEKKIHKTALMEVLLYLFASPFSHDLMRLWQSHYGLVQKRGPRFLLVYGQTYRGKTTFLAFALSLIAGRTIDPLSAKTFFKEGFIRKALSYRTTFPLIFDDMATISSAQFEGVVKNYWEKDWTGRDPVPQLVFSTNRTGLRQSVISRVKKVYFPVYIEPTPQKKKVLNQLRERESSNHLFEWFAHVYLELLSAQKDPPPEDELFLARSALQRLYSYAGRALPDFFPSTPFEELYDTREAEWKDLLFGLKKAEVRDTGGRILIEFHEDMSRDDILPYATMLPLATDHQEKGNTIIIQSPAVFRKWLSLPEPASQQLPAASSAPAQPRGLGAKLRSLLGRSG